MRWLRLLVGALGAVHALPQAVSKSASSPGSYNDTLANNSTAHRPSNGTNSTRSTLPESGGGSIAITDPVRLAYFQKKHAEVVKGFQEGRAMPLYHFLDLVDLSELSDGPDPVDKRQVLPIIAGFFVILELLTDIGDLTSVLLQIANQIAALFMQSNIVWWSTTTRCRVHFQTQGGSNEDFYVINKGSNTHIFESKENIGWSNFDEAPHVFYYDTADTVGVYSVQMTATDTHAYYNYTEKCYIQGLCNPQYIFFHDGYHLILNTWQTQGVESKCQYSNGGDCGGICSSGVLNQFESGGVVWGGDCGVPCYDEAGDLPKIINQAPKIMVVGDSISHGMQDDWTWRYRTWSWLKKFGFEATFVGPYTGTHGTPGLASSEPMAPPLPGEEALNFQVEGGYNSGVDSAFTSSGHASYWGRQATQMAPLIHDWVDRFQPDYLLILLGFNDLGWFAQGPEGLIGQMGLLVENAREAKADIKLLVGNVVQRLFIDGRQDLVDNTNTYNALLKSTLPNWYRGESPIAYVDVAAQYGCSPDNCPDGYDGLHPDVLGEHHIAKAFCDRLVDSFGFLADYYQIPASLDGRPVSTPTNVKAVSYPEGIFTTWDSMVNNRGYRVRTRVAGAADWWSDGLVFPNTWGSWLSWILPGQKWEMQVATHGDGDTLSDWSASVFVTANPATAPGPSTIVDYPVGNDGIQVLWSPVTGYDVHCYGVLVWDRDTPNAFLGAYATQDTLLQIPGLKSGHRYNIWVATYINLNPGSLTSFAVTPGGLPAPGADVIVGGGVPEPPSAVSYVPIDGTTLTLSWPAVANAAGYTIYMKSVSGGGNLQVIGSTTATSQGIAFVFPGIWTYQFCVGSYNGLYQSGPVTAKCVTPVVCCGYTEAAAAVHGPAAAVYKNTSSSSSASSSSSTPSLPSPSLITAASDTSSGSLSSSGRPSVFDSSMASDSNSTINATLLTVDPLVGQLYSMYTQALATVLQNGTTLNLTFAAPDTVIRLF